MKSFNQIVTDFATFSKDSDSDLAKSLVNMAIHYIMSLADWNFNKDSITILSVASQQDYPRPVQADKIRYMNVYTGNLWYVPEEIKRGSIWQKLNYTNNNFADQPQYWYTSNNSQKCSLYPIPTSDGNTIKIGYTKKVLDYQGADYYTNGYVSASAGGTVFTGSGGASFTKDMIGRYISIGGTGIGLNGSLFEIIDVPSSTTLTVKQSTPSDITNATFTIAEMIPFLDGFENISLFYALDNYYQIREIPKMAEYWQKKWETMLDEMKTRDFRAADKMIKKQTPIEFIDVNQNPWSISIINP